MILLNNSYIGRIIYTIALIFWCISCVGAELFYNPCIGIMLLTTSILLAQIRKPPDIAKTHAVSDNTEKELHFPTPRRPILVLRFLAADDILTSCRHDRHVMSGLAMVV